jgi:hypothetical protein
MVRVTNTPDCCSGDPLIPEVPRIRFRHVLDRVAKVARLPVRVTWFSMLEPLLEEPGVLAVSTLIQITQMKFVTFVSLVSLVSDVSLCPPRIKGGLSWDYKHPGLLFPQMGSWYGHQTHVLWRLIPEVSCLHPTQLLCRLQDAFAHVRR